MLLWSFHIQEVDVSRVSIADRASSKILERNGVQAGVCFLLHHRAVWKFVHDQLLGIQFVLLSLHLKLPDRTAATRLLLCRADEN